MCWAPGPSAGGSSTVEGGFCLLPVADAIRVSRCLVVLFKPMVRNLDTSGIGGNCKKSVITASGFAGPDLLRFLLLLLFGGG